MIERFRYHARAFGVIAEVKLPFDATAPVQAAPPLAPNFTERPPSTAENASSPGSPRPSQNR